LMNEVVKFAVNQDSALGTASTKDTGTAAGEVPLNSSLVPKSGGIFTGDIAAPKITASTGILFGTDTAAANTLDDYEEGTFTPSFDSGFTVTYGLQTGEYIKIGNLVYITLQIDTSTLSGSGSGSLILVGFPYAATDSSSLGIHRLEGLGVDLSAAGPIAVDASNGLIYYSTDTTSSHSTVLGDELTSSTSMRVSGTYTVA